MNNSWNEELEVVLDEAVVKRQNNNINTFFNAWRSAYTKVKMAQHHTDKELQKKCLSAWRQMVTQKQVQKIKLRDFQIDHLQRKVCLPSIKAAYAFMICFIHLALGSNTKAHLCENLPCKLYVLASLDETSKGQGGTLKIIRGRGRSFSRVGR